MLVFPTWRFPFKSKEFDIAMATISGGTSLSGVEDVIATDGGGHWYADLGNADLYSRDRVMLWRAFKAALHGGVDAFIFPVCDIRHQPSRGRLLAPHSDGAGFSDETLYENGDCGAETTVDLPLRSTQATISMALGKPLIGGERFTINHPDHRARCYQIGQIFEQTETGARFQFHPPLREAVSAGTEVDFNDPRCVMRINGNMSAPLAGPRWATGSVSLVEDFRGVYS